MSARCSIFVCCTDNRLALSDLNDACLEIVCDAAKRAQRSALSGGNGNQRSHNDNKIKEHPHHAPVKSAAQLIDASERATETLVPRRIDHLHGDQ